tara:strand:+ start:1080 stop:1337 length:258 start_codon:yes stop_codon:yes gene_type:complete
MKTLFQSQDRQGFLVLIDINQSDIEQKLWNWLEEKHHDVYLDIELWEGGSVNIDVQAFKSNNPIYITFSGDNGIFELEEVETEEV